MLTISSQDYPRQIEEKIARLSPEAGLMRWDPDVHGPWVPYRPDGNGGDEGHGDGGAGHLYERGMMF